jgi:hypothetical protein
MFIAVVQAVCLSCAVCSETPHSTGYTHSKDTDVLTVNFNILYG